jgi:hypothetical protein
MVKQLLPSPPNLGSATWSQIGTNFILGMDLDAAAKFVCYN